MISRSCSTNAPSTLIWADSTICEYLNPIRRFQQCTRYSEGLLEPELPILRAQGAVKRVHRRSALQGLVSGVRRLRVMVMIGKYIQYGTWYYS